MRYHAGLITKVHEAGFSANKGGTTGVSRPYLRVGTFFILQERKAKETPDKEQGVKDKQDTKGKPGVKEKTDTKENRKLLYKKIREQNKGGRRWGFMKNCRRED